MRNITSRSILLLTLALSLTPCWSKYNVVIEQESQCNEPLRESASKEGDPTKLIFTEYLDYINNTIESEEGREKLNQPDIELALQDVFDSLANETCRTLLVPLHGDDACKDDTIFIHDNATGLKGVFLFNICEKGFEFINNNIDNTAAPSLSPLSPSLSSSDSPTDSPTDYPPKEVLHTLQIIGEGRESNVDQTILKKKFEALVIEVVDIMQKDYSDLIHIRTVFTSKKACLKPTEESKPCDEFIFTTSIYLKKGNEENKLDNIAEQLQIEVDKAFETSEFEKDVCKNVGCRIVYILNIETNGPTFVLPLIGGFAAGAVFILLGFVTNYKGGNRNNSDDDSKINIEVGFPIPSILENTDPFELEQRVPFTDDNENVFSASFD